MTSRTLPCVAFALSVSLPGSLALGADDPSPLSDDKAPSADCIDLHTMLLLAEAEGDLRVDELEMIRKYKNIACEPVDGESVPTSWPNGYTAKRSDGTWQYPSTYTAKRSDGTWQYPSTYTASRSDGAWQYPSTYTARRSDGTWQDPDTYTTTVEKLLAYACGDDEKACKRLRRRFNRTPEAVKPAFLIRAVYRKHESLEK